MCDWLLIFLYIFCLNVWFGSSRLFNMDKDNNQQRCANIRANNLIKLCQIQTEESLLKQYQEQRRQFIEFEEKFLSQWQRFGYSSAVNQYNPSTQPMWKSRRYPRSLLCQLVRLFSTLILK